jgi:hypothetical protein
MTFDIGGAGNCCAKATLKSSSSTFRMTSSGHVLACPIQQAATLKEMTYVQHCLEQQHARSW